MLQTAYAYNYTIGIAILKDSALNKSFALINCMHMQ